MSDSNLRDQRGALCRDERGAAIATVAMLGLAVVILAAVIVTRSVNTYQHTASNRGFEESFHVAESGVDDMLNELSQGGLVAESADPLDSKAKVVAAAEALVLADPNIIEQQPDGDYVAFKDASQEAIYSVGFSPSFADARRQVRVVETTYVAVTPTEVVPGWTGEFALLSGGDLEITGNSRIRNPGANVHTNGSLDAFESSIEGCGSESIDSGYVGGVGCPESPLPQAPIPIVDPYMAYHLSWFDMCPDGQAHAGPAHPTTPNPTKTPCAGPLIPGRQGMAPTADGWANHDKKTPPGVYYVIGDFDGRIGLKNDLEVTVITAKTTEVTSSLDCTVAGGDVWLTSQSSSVGHPSAGGLTIVSAGDIVFRGGAEFSGLLLAHEQIDYKGNSSVTGAVVAEHACSEPASPITGPSVVSGTADVYWVGPVTTPFDATVINLSGPVEITITDSREL